jgi:hypothetical protein
MLDRIVTPVFVISAVWLVWVVSWFAVAGWTGRTVKRPNRGREVGYRLLVTVGAILLFTPSEPPSWRVGRFVA